MSDFAHAPKRGGAPQGDALDAQGELAEALRRAVEQWMRHALADEEVLASLGEGLRPHLGLDRPSDADAAAGATAGDLQAVVEALLLLEARVGSLEERLTAAERRGPDRPADGGEAGPARRGAGRSRARHTKDGGGR